jgi:hypothetical protein
MDSAQEPERALLRADRDDAWAEVRTADGGAVIEMRDRSHHVHATVDDVAGAVLATEWYFFAGRLPEGAVSMEAVADGGRYGEDARGGYWLAAIPRDRAVAGIKLIPVDGSGQGLEAIDLEPWPNAPPKPAVPRADLGPERAPVTLRPSLGHHLRRQRWIVALFLAVAIANLALGYPLLALLAAGLVALVFWPMLPGVAELRLDHDDFTRRGWLWRQRRYRWAEVGMFRPAGTAEGDGIVCSLAPSARHSLSQSIYAAMSAAEVSLEGIYGMTRVELAALMNAWREDWHVQHPSAVR